MDIQIKLTREEVQVVLQMIMQFNWAGQNLESTEKNVAIGSALRNKFQEALSENGK